MRIFDLHCDALTAVKNGDKTIKECIHELKKGGVKAQCFAAFSGGGGDKGEILSQAEIYKELSSAAEIKAYLTVENAGFTRGETAEIDELYKMGVRLLSLTHNGENKLAYPCSENKDIHLKGLKGAGVRAVEYMDSIGITLDVSHLNMGGFYDVSRICRRPIVATHSCCNTIYRHARNLYDSQLRIIARSGGIVGICFFSRFLNGTDSMSANDIVRQAKHIANIAGIDAVALGSDFYGMENGGGIKSPVEYGHILEKLNGCFSADECEKICYKNAERIFNS